MLSVYRKRLIALWASGFIIPFILIVFQFGNGKYGPKFAEAFGWLSALTLPTILLMIGVMVANPSTMPLLPTSENPNETDEKAKEVANEARNKEAHERFIFMLAMGVSLLYLVIVNLVFFLEPFASSKPQELMRDSKIFLAVFDSLISLLIGYFFGKR